MTGGDHDDPSHGSDDAGVPSPPDPLDRLWRHPSELGGVGTAAAPETDIPVAQGNALWLTALGAGMLGAVSTLAILALLGLLGAPDRAVKPVAGATPDRTIARLAGDGAGRSVVELRARRADGSWTRTSALYLTAGQAITSAHTLAFADPASIVLTRSDGISRPAKVVGTDPITDITVLDVGDAFTEDAPIERNLGTGDSVVAVAASGEGQPWVSTGVAARIDAVVAVGPQLIPGLIETDATVNDRASGGALADSNGHVIGIILTSNAGRAVAMPIDVARTAANEIRKKGSVDHALLGITVRDTDTVVIDSVDPAGPAAGAGLKPGMIVRKIDGRPISVSATLAAEIMRRRPGDRVRIEVRTGGNPQSFEITLAARPPTALGTPAAATSIGS